MHPIERFGLISLLILTGSVTAIALYEGQPDPAETKLTAKADRGAAEREAEAQRQQLERQKENERRERAAQMAREALAAKEQKAASQKGAGSPSLSDRGASERTRQATLALAAEGGSKGSSQGRRWSERSSAEPELNSGPGQRDQLSTPGRTVRDPEADLAAREEQARKALPQAGGANLGRGLSTPAPKPQAERSSTGGTQRSSGSKRTGAPAGAREYVVAKGEVASVISERELGSHRHTELIQELNPKLDLDRIYAGQVIFLPLDVPSTPAPKATQAVAKETTKQAQPAAALKNGNSTLSGGSYRVAEGESLWGIAQRELGDGNLWTQIAEVNPKLDPHRLEPGTLLTLPKGNGTTEVAQQRSGSGSVVSKVR